MKKFKYIHDHWLQKVISGQVSETLASFNKGVTSSKVAAFALTLNQALRLEAVPMEAHQRLNQAVWLEAVEVLKQWRTCALNHPYTTRLMETSTTIVKTIVTMEMTMVTLVNNLLIEL